jgi:hypothetical protein
MHMPPFRCDAKSSFCIVKFGVEFGYLNKAEELERQVVTSAGLVHAMDE